MVSDLRIVSLLPAATEIVYFLGLEKYLVGVSHGCDYPKEVLKLPKITTSEVTNILSSKEIDDKVKHKTHRGDGIFHIDEKILSDLKPNLILTQELCEVCAISWTEVHKACRFLELSGEESEPGVKIISLEPESIGDILENISLIGESVGKTLAFRKLVGELKRRLEFYELRFKNLTKRRKVLVIEWLEPLMVAGHWVPEMVEKAGGMNVKTKIGDKSCTITIEEIIREAPSIVIVAPCGFDIKRTMREKKLIDELRLKTKKLGCKFYLMDGDAYLTRPGPRIINGVEILAEILDPEIFPRTRNLKDWREFKLL